MPAVFIERSRHHGLTGAPIVSAVMIDTNEGVVDQLEVGCGMRIGSWTIEHIELESANGR